MAFTAKLGTSDSRLGNIVLGSRATSFTADAFILSTQGATLTADSYVRVPGEGAFLADAFVRPFFRADAILKKAIPGSFTANADILLGTAKVTSRSLFVYVNRSTDQDPSDVTSRSLFIYLNRASFLGSFTANAFFLSFPGFTANAVIVSFIGGFEVDAIVKGGFGGGGEGGEVAFFAEAWLFEPGHVYATFYGDSVIANNTQWIHDRTVWHRGVDSDLDQILATGIGDTLRGAPLADLLAEIDARLTSREAGRQYRSRRLTADAAIFAPLGSLLASAILQKPINKSFTASARLRVAFTANAVIFKVKAASFASNAVKRAVTSAAFAADAEIV